MIKQNGNFNVQKLISRFESAKNSIPKKIANEVKNHFLDGFRKGGGQTNESKGGWEPRKREDRKRRGRALLVDSGDLRADILTRQMSPHRVVVGTRNIEYAIWHNEGTDDDRPPQREFIGESKELEIKIRKIITGSLSKVKP